MVETGKINPILVGEPASVDYSRFKSLQFGALGLPPRTLVRGVPVSALLTSREALEQDMILDIASHFRDGRCITPVPAYRVILRGSPNIGLVSDHGIHIVGAASVNRINRVDVLLQPQEERPSGISVVRSIGKIARPHKALLRIPLEAEAYIVDIHSIKEGGFALRFNGKKPFRTDVVSLETNEGKVSKVSFVGQDGKVISARVAGDSVNKLPIEIINKLLIDSKG